MVQFVLKFICLFYVAATVDTRTLHNNFDNYGKTGDVFGYGMGNYTREQNKNKIEGKVNFEEMKKILADVTEKVNHLNEQYGPDKYQIFPHKLDKIVYEFTHRGAPKTTSEVTIATTEDVDFIGTAQIEELLNDIKARAIQMVAEQNPSVTDMITNTVTEATFEADPILTHLEISSPGYAFSTFVVLQNVENIDKRTANDSNIILISNKHNVSVRSVKEDAYTIAHSVEDMLQQELKNIYNKVKSKVSHDFHNEVNTAKATLKCETDKVMNKVTKTITGAKTIVKTPKLTTTKLTTASRHSRGHKASKKMKKTSKNHETTTSTPTVDDFAMLTLYEQILAKTHEDNVMKMLTTNNKRKIDKNIRLSKRNPETLADLTLKEDMKRIYDDGENIPDLDYSNDVVTPDTSNDYSLNSNTNRTTVKFLEAFTAEAEPVEDTSYEGLSDKIAYKDYVNGYKNYLKFQKDQSKQNFSALVKYQAHRHHKVEDIGKFILNKIPQIPDRKKRFFFDDSDMDEQDISTKSDDSWFKKHFYMFIDNGPPKKYHTSETVEFKGVTEPSKVGYLSDSIERPRFQVTVTPLDADRTTAADINLDELSKLLEDRKATGGYQFGNIPFHGGDMNMGTTTQAVQNKVGVSSGPAYNIYAPNIISKLFGKGRSYPSKDTQKHNENTLKYDDDDDNTFLFDSDIDRYRRNAKNNENAENVINEKLPISTLLNKQENAKHGKTKSYDKKVGCVSLVTQPTALVHLYKPNVKESRIRKLLGKLHFRKRNKKKIKEKRHCTRVQRFNPLKKLKDMFMPKPEEKVGAKNHHVADYDMITSHIDTFKPVKYDKIPSIDELKIQVPNITGENMLEEPPEEASITKPSREWVVPTETKQTNKILTNAATSAEVKTYPVTANIRQFQLSPKTPAKTSSTPKIDAKHILIDNIAVTNGVMNVKVKTGPKTEDTFNIMSPLEEIKNEINKLNLKMPTNLMKIDPKPNIQEQNNNIADDREFNNNFTIKAKLTRIAKFPVAKLKSKHSVDTKPSDNDLKFYEFVNDGSYLNVHEESYPHAATEKKNHFDRPYTNKAKFKGLLPLIDVTLKNLDNVEEAQTKDLYTQEKTHPDYFHDLVMWNNDILNNDKVFNPMWQDILNNINGPDFTTSQDFTTPNIKIMEKELHDITENFRNNENIQKETKQTFNVKPITIQSSSVLPVISTTRGLTTKSDVKIVDNNKLKKYPTFEDFDEDPLYVLRNYPKMHSKVNFQDINVLNKLYEKQLYANQDKANTHRASTKWESKEYDLTHPTERMTPRKVITKNSVKYESKMNKGVHPIAKLNKQPQQFYNTPLPMKNEKFEKFLKENRLDVESVTLPMNEMPEIMKSWHSSINPLMKTINFSNMNVQSNLDKSNKAAEDLKKPNKVAKRNDIEEIDKSYPENQIEYLNDLEQDLFDDYRENVNVRYKRSSLQGYDTFSSNAGIGKKLKDKLNNIIFDKKFEASTAMKNLNSVSNPSENEVEVTIINFDDTNQKSDNEMADPTEPILLDDNTTFKSNTKAFTQTKVSENNKNQAVAKKATKKPLENINFQIKKCKSETDHNNVKIISKASSAVKDDVTTKLLHFPMELKDDCKDKHQNNVPHRVQISSHSYKYDVLYKVPHKKDNIWDEEDDMEKKRRHDVDNEKKSKNSKISQIIVVVDVVKAVDDFTRPDNPIHIDLPTYYAPNTEIGRTELLPVNLKTSWTDLVLKYISGIALIEMLSKLGVLKGGLNLTDGLNVNFDHDKVFSKDGVVENDSETRAKRAAKTTKKRHTFSQELHFTREMRQRDKRLFKLLPIIKEKMNLFMKTISTDTINATSKPSIKSSEVISVTRLNSNYNPFTKLKNLKNNSKNKVNEHKAIIFEYKDESEDNEKINGTTDSSLLTPNAKPMNNTKDEINLNNVDDPVDDDQVCKTTIKTVKAVKKAKIRSLFKEKVKSAHDLNAFNKLKRDINPETYTAKDVAAFEVIVDLLRNTVNYGENKLKTYSDKFFGDQRAKARKNSSDEINHVTNSIQVHIAIPYDMPDKKRSLEPLKVRKVFTAKMATPVDLEYQINSIEDNTATTLSPDLDCSFSPGMYLLVDDPNNSKGSFALKPVKALPEQLEDIEKIDCQTKTDKIALTKEFVAAVNKHLIQLYENITQANADEKKISKHKVTRRESRWDRVRKLFKNDRVCNCKCKANKTMCRACLASDAVIRELTFEFDNLARYMTDHCTEIQTFFWMNPSGGRALRDLVHKIDKSLNEYYKRVKGKCTGRTCKTFATYIDKRDFVNDNKAPKSSVAKSSVNDPEHVKFDISSNLTPRAETLRGAKLVNVTDNSIVSKHINKRSNVKEKIKLYDDKEIYTLDNISVNIICSPDAASNSVNSSSLSLIEAPVTADANILLDYDLHKNMIKKLKKNRMFGRPKFRFNKLFTYYENFVTPADIFKREAKYNQIESPLITDTGGSFWHEYIQKGKLDANNEYNKPNVEISVIQTKLDQTPITQVNTKSFKDKLKDLCKKKIQVTATAARSGLQRPETSTNALTSNVHEIFKLFGSTKDGDVKDTFTDPTINTKHRKHTTKHKKKKRTKIRKTSKAKMHRKHKTKTKKNKITDTPTTAYNISKASDILSTEQWDSDIATTEFSKITGTKIESTIKAITATQSKNTKSGQATIEKSTKSNFFHKLKMATFGFLGNIGKGNHIVNEKSTNAMTDSSHITAAYNHIVELDSETTKIAEKNVISEPVTNVNPTLLIINNDGVNDDTKESKSKFKDIWLSLINFEAEKLKKIDNLNENELNVKQLREADLVDSGASLEDLEDIENTLMRLKLKQRGTTPEPDVEYDILKGMKVLQTLEKPAPIGIQLEPGLLEKVARKFSIKMVPDEKAGPSAFVPKTSARQHYVIVTPKKLKPRRETSDFEEAEPFKTSNFDVLTNIRSNKRINNQESKNFKRKIKQRMNIDEKKNVKYSTNKSKRNGQYERTLTLQTHSGHYANHYKTEFDSYIREEKGIYRLKRNTSINATVRKNKQKYSSFSNKDIPNMVMESGKRRNFKKQRSKHKRSSANGIENKRLSLWIQHTTGYFLATITCFYIVFALLAAVVNWAFRK